MPDGKQKVYLAAPLFGITERRANRMLAEALARLAPGVEIILPQDIKYHGKYNDAGAFGAVFRDCLAGIDACAAVVAILDGPDADSGTCFEAGYAYAKGIPVIGVRTDYRPSQERGVNVMLSRGCTALVYRPAFDENVEALARDVAKALRKVLKV